MLSFSKRHTAVDDEKVRRPPGCTLFVHFPPGSLGAQDKHERGWRELRKPRRNSLLTAVGTQDGDETTMLTVPFFICAADVMIPHAFCTKRPHKLQEALTGSTALVVRPLWAGCQSVHICLITIVSVAFRFQSFESLQPCTERSPLLPRHYEYH